MLVLGMMGLGVTDLAAMVLGMGKDIETVRRAMTVTTETRIIVTVVKIVIEMKMKGDMTMILTDMKMKDQVIVMENVIVNMSNQNNKNNKNNQQGRPLP